MNTAAAVNSLRREYPKAELAYYTVDVACSPQAFYSVITDYESYPDFVPSQRRARILAVEQIGHRERFTVALELSLVKHIRYELAAEGVPGHSLRWSLIRGDFMRENAGGWLLEELEDGRTRATLYLAVILKGWLPRSVINALVTKTCPATVLAFKAEAERRTTV